MSRNKKITKPVVLIIVTVLIAVLIIPFFKLCFKDGGSDAYHPLIPWYVYINYHQLPDNYPPHSTGDETEKPDFSSYPLYVGGHGLILFGVVTIVFDKYEVYPDGHKENISGLNVGLG